MPHERQHGSCLGHHFIFAIINLLLTIKCIILDSVSKILFIFFIANNNNNYDSNIKNILLHNGYKIINLRYPIYMYQFLILLIIAKIECWPKQDPMPCNGQQPVSQQKFCNGNLNLFLQCSQLKTIYKSFSPGI